MAVMKMKEPKGIMDSGKYIRYTPEQVEALERVYNECPKPSSIRRQQLLREYPLLANIEPRQIKVWFQNRRCREKQRKETSRLQSVNSSLTAMNKIIMEENERLTKHNTQLALDNQYLRQQLQQQTGASDREPKTTSSRRYNNNEVVAADRSPDSEVTGGMPQQHITATTAAPQIARDSSHAGLLAIAEETLAEFLAKATGTAVDWIHMPGMKPGPDSVGTAAISHGSTSVAARAWGLVGLEPSKVAEILKDRPSWHRECRRLEVLRAFSTPNGGTVELVYTQMYAPTTLAAGRDFWTIRYTSFLEDGLVICERSLNGIHGGPSNKQSGSDFVRAEMLPSGYLIRPYEGGMCSIHIVDHMELESWKVLEVLRPLYESSSVLAQKMTLAALRYLRRLVYESSVERGAQQIAAWRGVSRRIARGFNEAVNCFTDDGWSTLVTDGVEDVTVAINTNPTASSIGGQLASADRLYAVGGGVLCAKASMLLQNVPPATLIRFLREHRSEWADCNITDSSLRHGMARGANAFIGQYPVPLIHSSEEEEFLEVVKLEGHTTGQNGVILPRETVLLQLCSGNDDNAVGACAQLVFAPVDAAVSDDVPLLPSGFRVIPLDSGLDGRTLDLASSLEGGAEGGRFAEEPSCHLRSVLTMAFQFLFEAHNRDDVAASARQYVRNVMVSVQSVALALASFRLGPRVGPRNVEALLLAQQILRSYKANFGLDLTESDPGSTDAFWHHKDAILCCTWKTIPEFIFANRAGLEMLDTTWNDLHGLPWDKTLDDNGRKSSASDFAQIIQQGFAELPAGIRISSKGRPAAYERVIAWKVLDEENNAQFIAYMFMNWSFLG
uniref:Class III homeodomain-leucine zipper protein C3HDZ2 n=1 Tax=Selaginella kraussiana TaxID=81964 RepID=Q20BL5_9TRAC|nr:class III homeodomain-leucine zipper protein C3HDZ2 [Selaginella kraussiana]